jgi:predicted HAD superfamily phosphohydrolase
MRSMQLDTDCEGPLALNDNAFELCRDFLKPDGDRFFKQVSRYDDYLADILKKEGYKAGDTLKLILPFLKAYGLTNEMIREYSRKTLMLVPGAEAAYRFLHSLKFPIFEISTSYRQFAETVGLKLGFDAAHIYCTDLDLDRHVVLEAEAKELKRLQAEITTMPKIDLPPEAASLADLPGPVQEAIGSLDEIFCKRIPEMNIGVLYQEVNPLGGAEKARALSESVDKTQMSLADTIYVGDSITDVQAFEAVRAGGGLGISFNGNRYAVDVAEVIVIADTVWPIALLVAVFGEWGKDGVLELAAPEGPGKSRSLIIPEAVIEPIAVGLQGHQFNLYTGGRVDGEKVAGESVAMRAKLRGAAIAALG